MADHAADPIEVAVPLSTHPDTALRRLGIIVQEGTHGLLRWRVRYDARADAWVRVATDKRLAATSADVTNRKDHLPRALIHVVGHLDLSTPTGLMPNPRKAPESGSLTPLPGSLGPRASGPANPLASFDLIGSRPNSSHQQDADRNDTFPKAVTITNLPAQAFSDHATPREIQPPPRKAKAPKPGPPTGQEQQNLLRRYITRSLVTSAHRTGALIINSASGEAAQLLSKGIRGIVQVQLQGAACDDQAQRLLLLGIHPYRSNRQVQRDPHFTHHLMLYDSRAKLRTRPNSTTPSTSRAQVTAYTQALIQDLTTHRLPTEPGDLPQRTPIHSVVTVLVGGSRKVVKFELLHSVNRGWPILILEGSGGYADILAKTVKRVRSLGSDGVVSKDDFRQCLGTVDALTAEILNQGHYLIIDEGTPPEDVEMFLEKSLMGNEILRKCWQEYATWMDNQNAKWRLYNTLQLSILAMQILTTFGAVFMTYCLLMWGNVHPRSWANANEAVTHLWQILQMSVISFPIIISLVQAIDNRLDPGGKSITLRCAAEDLISQILRYRTMTGEYSAKGLKDMESKVKDRLPPGTSLTKDMMLNIKLQDITTSLYQTDISSGGTILPYKGILPPKDIRDLGDDGFMPMSPDQYVYLRLQRKQDYYHNLAVLYGRTAQVLSISIDTFVATGSCIAALAAYRYNELETWVAFTTCLVSSLRRYTDYSRTEWRHQKYNKTYMQLCTVGTWWSAQGAIRQQDSRNTLVEQTERAISDEVDAWSQQMHKAIAKERSERKEQNEELMRMLREQEGYQQAMKDLGMEWLDHDAVMEAISNPNGPDAEKLLAKLGDLANQIGGLEQVKEVAGEVVKTVEDVVDKAEELQKAIVEKMELIKSHALGVADKVPDMLESLVAGVDSLKLPDRLGEGMVRIFGYLDVLDSAQQTGAQALDLVQRFSQRQVLETGKQVLVEQIFTAMVESVDSTIYKLLLEKTTKEDVVAEFWTLAAEQKNEMQSMQQVGITWKKGSLVNILKNQDIKNVLFALDEELRLKVAPRLAEVAHRLHYDGENGIRRMFDCLCSEISDLDIDELHATAAGTAGLLETRRKIQKLGATLKLELLPKEDILLLFPKEMHAVLRTKSQVQLASYLKKVKVGTFAQMSVGTLVHPQSLNHWRNLEEFVARLRASPPDLQECLIVTMSKLSQSDANRMSKMALLNQIRSDDNFHPGLLGLLEGVTDGVFTEVVSAVLGVVANSPSGRLFSILASEGLSLDLRELVPVPYRAELVKRLRQITVLDPQARESMSVETFLTTLGHPKLIESFESMEPSIWRGLVRRARGLSAGALPIHMFTRVLQEWIEGGRFPLLLQHLRASNVDMRALILHFGLHVESQDFGAESARGLYQSTEDLLQLLGDQMLPPLLARMDVGPVLEVFADLSRALGRDNILTYTYNDLLGAIGPGLREKFVAVFTWHENQRRLVEDIEQFNWIVKPPSEQDFRTRYFPQGGAQAAWPPFAGTAFTCEEAYLVVSRLLQNLTVHRGLPYRLWMHLCWSLPHFDLCSIIPDPLTRHKMMGCLVLLFDKERDKPRQSKLEEEPLVALNRKQIISRFTGLNLRDGEYLASFLRLLSQKQLQDMLACAKELLTKHWGGRLFTTYTRETLLFKDTDKEDAITTLLLHIYLEPMEVSKLFEGFDAQAFCRRTQADRQKLLSRYLQSEHMVEEMLRYEEKDIEDIFEPLREWVEIRHVMAAAKQEVEQEAVTKLIQVLKPF
uniref:SMODS and SLOG-associating 2TM effector domain-containing protein n=1 Tax=Eutreptiella gymnastica TaxID=73025 RepID=A0A7S1I802_9EUGL